MDFQLQSNNDKSEKSVHVDEVDSFSDVNNHPVKREGDIFFSALEPMSLHVPDRFGLKSEKASNRSASR